MQLLTQVAPPGAAFKIRTTIANCAPRSRTAWTEQVAFPWAADAPPAVLFVADDGRQWLGVRGEDVGQHSATYRFWVIMAANEVVRGTVIELPPSHPVPKFATHPWVSDDLAAIVPMGTLLAPDGSILENLVPLAGPELVSFSSAHQRWYAKAANAELGLVQEWWADVCHQDPVVKMWTCITWSDRRDKARLRTHWGVMGLRSGEVFAADFADRHGWARSEHEGKKLLIFGANQTFADGCSIPVTGSMLCFRGPHGGDTGPFGKRDLEDINSLEAAKGGPCLGVCHEWSGSFLGAKHTPVAGNYPSDAFEWEHFLQLMQQRASLHAPRPLGCAPYPGQTGDQQDFGSSKGTSAVTRFDPRYLYEARYSMQCEFFRGYRHFESDGARLEPSRHPNWITWGGKTGFWLRDPSDDATLGKDGGYHPDAPGGYTGHDDEHMSLMEFAANIALCGDPMLLSQLQHKTTTDICSYTHKLSTTGPMRAEGRTISTWANMALLLSSEERRRALELVGRRVALASAALASTSPMKLMAWHDPDQRKPIYRDDGTLAKSATLWELGLQLVGMACAWRSGQCPDQSAASFVLVQLARTMADYGCFKQGGQWFIVSDIEWRDGADVDLQQAREFEPGKWHGAIFAANAGDVRSWTANGMLVARAALRDVDPARALKLSDCLTAMGIDIENPRSQRDAEWWAVVTP